jgi:PAS domain S-box-containing protein
MPQLGWTARADGYIDFYNRGWYEYTGTTFEQMEGWGWKSVHEPTMLDDVLERWANSIATGRDFEMEFPLRRYDGVFRWFLTRGRPLRDADGNVVRWVGINSDVTPTRQLEQSLERERLGLREIFHLAPAFIALIRGPEHVFVVANPFYMRLVGETRSIVGLPVREALPEIEGQGFFELLDTVYATGIPFTGKEVRVKLSRGGALEERFVDFVYQPTRDDDEKVNGIFVHGSDVTEQVHARQLVERQATELERANRTKDQFLATLSHELRTPMTAVLGWARLLKMGLSAPEADVAIDAIERSAATQAQLIEDVLDISRITSGKLTFEPHAVDLVTVAQAAMMTVHPAAVAKNIEVLTGFPPLVPSLSGDEGRLQQVIWNLLSNAIKFTPKGGRVTIRIAQVGSILRLTVEDTGQGIERELLPHVFEAFRQGDSSTTRSEGGIGLGLAIVRSLIEMHGGQIFAESDGRGKGARFTMEVPVLESAPTLTGRPKGDERLTSERSDRPLPAIRGTTILIIDDQEYTREVVAAMIRRMEATVHVAASVREGLRLFDAHVPDVVICDIAMPGEDGYSFVRTVRAMDGPASGTPIVALTAFGRPEDRQNALAAGFNAYLKKPVDPQDLGDAVRSLTGKKSEV